MAHVYRFQGERQGSQLWAMSEEEQHHLRKVLRLGPGAICELADGRGWVASVELLRVGKHELDWVFRSEVFTPQSTPRRAVAIGALKPQAIDELLPALVELGVDRIVLYPFEGMDGSRMGTKARERWLRIVAAASKQCKRPWWPELIELASFEELLDEGKNYAERGVLDPEAPTLLADWLPKAIVDRLLVVGPEKGLTFQELQLLADQGFTPLRIQAYVLRAVTAAIGGATLLCSR